MPAPHHPPQADWCWGQNYGQQIKGKELLIYNFNVSIKMTYVKIADICYLLLAKLGGWRGFGSWRHFFLSDLDVSILD